MTLLILLTSICLAQNPPAQSGQQTTNQPTSQQTAIQGPATPTNSGTNSIPSIRRDLDRDLISVNQLMKGRPTITAIPTYKNGAKFSSGITFSNSSGNALTFNDGTTQNSAFSTAVSSVGFWSGATTSGVLSYPTCQGSTFTVTTGAYKLEVYMSITADTVNGNVDGAVILLDGKPMDTFSSSFFNVKFQNNSASHFISTYNSTYITASAVSAASHTFCVVPVIMGAAEAMACNVGPCYLKIREFRN